MVKKCMICSEPAQFSIKDTNDFYCEECAKENFSDLDVLETIEDRAKKLKAYIEEKLISEEEEKEEE